MPATLVQTIRLINCIRFRALYKFKRYTSSTHLRINIAIQNETQWFLASKYHETLPNELNCLYSSHLNFISQDFKNVKKIMASSTNSAQKLIEIFPCFNFKLQSTTMVATRKFIMKSNSRCYLIFYVCFPMLQHERVKNRFLLLKFSSPYINFYAWCSYRAI